MDNEIVHLNPSRVQSNLNVILLLIPIVTFALALTVLAITFKNNQKVLGESTSDLDRTTQVTPK